MPWATALLAVWVTALYLYDPPLNTLTGYYFLSPWTHSGLDHYLNNMVFLLPLGVYVEHRVGSFWFLAFSLLTPYFAIHVPVLVGLGGLSEGASGLTKALTGYAIPILIVEFVHRLSDLRDFGSEWKMVAVAVVVLIALVVLIASARLTVWRFVGLEASPEHISVGSHLIGLIIGVLWFAWRAWRHGLDEA